MSAVMKENPVSDAEENTDLAVIETKSLAELLAIGDECPADFYKNPDYLERVKTVKLLAGSLVHTPDEKGRADSKKDAAAIRKFAKTTNKFAINIFRSLTEKMTNWRNNFTVEIKELEAIADGIDAKFEKMEKERLDSIKTLLANTLDEYRIEIGLRPEFYGEYNLSPMVKLSGTLTDGGKLTSKALGFVKTIANGELTLQQRFDSRVIILENRCLRADINPPLTAISMGNELYGTDEAFDAKVEALITAETKRKTEMEERLKVKVEADNQKVLDAALADQQKEAVEIVRQEQPQPAKQITETETVKLYPDISVNMKASGSEQPRVEERLITSSTGARVVRVWMMFEWPEIPETTSNKGVENFLTRKLPEQMQAKLKQVSSEDV